MSTKKKQNTAPAKARKTAEAPAPKTPEKPKVSLIAAALAVLEESDEALNTKQMVEAAKAKGLWTPGTGKTPEQTLYSAIIRDIKSRGEMARFKLVSKGHFTASAR